MDESRKKIPSLRAAFIAVLRLMFLVEESPFALRDALSDSIRKAEILLTQPPASPASAAKSNPCRPNLAPTARAAAIDNTNEPHSRF